MAKRENANLLKTAKKKKPRIRNTIDLDLRKMYGEQPVWNENWSIEDEDYEIKFGAALNWCSRGLEYKDGRKELIYWMEENKYSKDAVRAIKALSDYEARTEGRLAFLINNNWELKPDVFERFKNDLNEWIEKGKKNAKAKNAESKAKDKEEEIRKDTQQSAAAKNAIDACEIFDYVHDALHFNNDFDEARLKALVKDKKAVVLTMAADHVKNMKAELELVGIDSDVTEAYSHIKKSKLKKLITAYDNALGVLEGTKINKQTVRKPRKKKVKSAAQQTKNVKFCEKDDTYNIVSASPDQLIGASKAVVFNVKKRKIGIFHAASEEGFSFKGTTLQNLDEKLSRQKTLRDTKESRITDKLTEFRKAPVKRVDKIFDDLSTTDTILTGRFGEDVVILKVYK